MKATDKNNEKKRKIKKKPIDKSKKHQVVVIAQEIKFARLLSGNEKKTRDKVLKALKKWLISCFEKNYEFKEDDFTRVWKGLFYAVWMSDKPLVQEDLCESIAGILDLFPVNQLSSALLLAKAGFKMLATEWFGIDQHRIDKFLMLVRRYLRGALRCVQRSSWEVEACKQFADMLSGKDGILALKTPLYARNATSMVVHIAECYLEEISKVSSGTIPPKSLCIMLQPFLAYLSQGASTPLCIASRRVLTELLRHGDPEDMDDADSEPGSDEEAKDCEIENGEADSDEEITNGPLDPRAGRVDVVLSALPVPAELLVSSLKELLPQAKGAGNRRARRCIELLEQFASGSHPLAPPEPVVELGPPLKPTKTAKALRALEKKLVANGDELALRGLSRKHRKRLLAKTRAGLSIVDDVPKPKRKHRNTTNGDWQVEETDQVVKDQGKRKRAHRESETECKHKRQKIEKQGNIETDAKLKEVVKKVPKHNKVFVKDKNSVKQGKDRVRDNKNNVKPLKNSVTDIKNNVKVKNSVKGIKNNVNVDNSVEGMKNNVKAKHSVKGIKNGHKAKNTVNIVKNGVNVKTNDKNTDVKNGEVKLFKKHNKVITKDTGKKINSKSESEAKLLVNKVKKFHKQDKNSMTSLSTPKKVKFVLKNNSMQGTMDYYKSIRESPNIPFDSSKRPSKTNLKPSTPSPINPFFKKKMTRRASFAAHIVY